MKRFQKILREKIDEFGIRPLGRAMGIPAQSLSNYVLEGQEPRAANLAKISKYFGEPVAALLMEVGEEDSVDNQLIEVIKKLPKTKKKAALEYLKSL